jgi:hypothetical protein
VAQVVKADGGEAGIFEQLLEVSQQVARVDRCSIGSAEDQPGFDSFISGNNTINLPSVVMFAQRFDRGGVQENRSPASARLRGVVGVPGGWTEFIDPIRRSMPQLPADQASQSPR